MISLLFSLPLQEERTCEKISKNKKNHGWQTQIFLAAKYSITKVSGDMHEYKN